MLLRHVTGDASRNQLLAYRSATDTWLRFDLLRQKWLESPFTELSLLTTVMPDRTSVVGLVGTSTTLTGSRLEVEPTSASTLIRYNALDLGDKFTHKLWRRVEIPTDRYYSGSPTMRFRVRGSAYQTVTGVDQGNGRFVFTFPRGQVATDADLEFNFPGMTASSVIEPPLVIDFVPRYRER